MAKKRVTRKTDSPPVPEDGKVAFQVRLDADLHGRMREIAEKAGISLNQLLQGMCRGLIDHAHVGEGRRLKDGFHALRHTPKCVFFGQPGTPSDVPEEFYEDYREKHGQYPEALDKGWGWFGLDFTERGVVSYD